MEGWQPISTAPRDGTEILCWFPWMKKRVVAAYRASILGGYWKTEYGYSEHEVFEEGIHPTLWHELPAPPTEEKS